MRGHEHVMIVYMAQYDWVMEVSGEHWREVKCRKSHMSSPILGYLEIEWVAYLKVSWD